MIVFVVTNLIVSVLYSSYEEKGRNLLCNNYKLRNFLAFLLPKEEQFERVSTPLSVSRLLCFSTASFRKKIMNNNLQMNE